MELQEKFLTDMSLTPINKVVYTTFLFNSDEKGNVNIRDVRELSEMLGISLTSVMTSLRVLEQRQYIKRQFIYHENSNAIKERHFQLLRS